jgi:hypothetical protein
MQDYDDFKVGDKVWCLMLGAGEVIDIGPRAGNYPVKVKFGDSWVETYTADGKINAAWKSRSLFFSEPKIEASVKRPFVPTLVGKTVWVRPGDAMGKVAGENVDSFWFESGTTYYKQLVGDVFEVIPENLLEKK